MRADLECPFKVVDNILLSLKSKTNIILVDFHAEATAEKLALAYYLDGRVSGVVGTHTHVQTADERVLPKGTSYISDLGMAGSLDSLIGMQKEGVIKNFLTQMPVKFIVDLTTPVIMTGALITIDAITGKSLNIERIKIIDEEINLEDL
jgi:metallophosphoesterase (TIGR00282 family)